MIDTAISKKERDEVAARREETRGGTAFYTPLCDIYETPAEVILSADLPGVEQEDLNLRYENGILTLHAVCAPRRQDSGYLLNEYGVGDYYRSFEVNETIDADKISAEFRDGVLKVRLPKAEALKPRKIPIKA